MRLDTECDVVVAADQPCADSIHAAIDGLRNDLVAEHLDVDAKTVTAVLKQTGSLIGTIDKLRKPGRTLVPYTIPELGDAEAWLADNEILDPEGPDQMFESLSRRSLFRKRRRIISRHSSPTNR